MLRFLDVVLTLVHLSIVGFNLFGWILKRTRKAHIISIVLTAASWLLLGIWFGMGYCPFTDWQWRVKAQLGEQNIPDNFIEYFVEKITGIDFASALVNRVVAVCFTIAALISIYVNFILPRVKKSKTGHRYA
jgi:hypothetical protein